MAAKSYYLDDAIINLVLRATAYVPTTGLVYVALYTVAPHGGHCWNRSSDWRRHSVCPYSRHVRRPHQRCGLELGSRGFPHGGYRLEQHRGVRHLR